MHLGAIFFVTITLLGLPLLIFLYGSSTPIPTAPRNLLVGKKNATVSMTEEFVDAGRFPFTNLLVKG